MIYDNNDILANYFYLKFKTIPNKIFFDNVNHENFNFNQYKYTYRYIDGGELFIYKFGIVVISENTIGFYYKNTNYSKKLLEQFKNLPKIEIPENNHKLYYAIYQDHNYMLSPLSYDNNENPVDIDLLNWFNSKSRIITINDSKKIIPLLDYSDRIFIVLPSDIINNFMSSNSFNFFNCIKDAILIIETQSDELQLHNFMNSLLIENFNFKIIIKDKKRSKIGYDSK